MISLITFYGSFYREGSITIALEFMDGGSLANVISQVGPIPEEVLASIAFQVFIIIYYYYYLLCLFFNKLFNKLFINRFFGVLHIFNMKEEFIVILNHQIY